MTHNGPKSNPKDGKIAVIKQIFRELFSAGPNAVDTELVNTVQRRIAGIRSLVTAHNEAKKKKRQTRTQKVEVVSDSTSEEEATEQVEPDLEEDNNSEYEEDTRANATDCEIPEIDLNYSQMDVDLEEVAENYCEKGDSAILQHQLDTCLTCRRKDILVRHPIVAYTGICMQCDKNHFVSLDRVEGAKQNAGCCICGIQLLEQVGCLMRCNKHRLCRGCCSKWFKVEAHTHSRYGCIVCNDRNIPKNRRYFRTPALEHRYSAGEVQQLLSNIAGSVKPFTWADCNRYGRRENGDPIISPHQKHAINVMIQKLNLGEGHVLGDDMGMGKTVTLAVFMHHVIRQAYELDYRFPTMLVTLLTLKPYWNQEIQAIFGQKNVVANLSGGLNEALKKLQLSGVLSRHHREEDKPPIWMQIYHAIPSDYEYIGNVPFLMMILDEPHRLKHPTSERFRCMYFTHAWAKFMATGSVIHHRVENIITLMALVVKDFGGAYELRLRSCVQEISELTQYGEPEALTSPLFDQLLTEFQDLVKPHITRRMKSEMSSYAVPKHDIIFVSCELAPEQRKVLNRLPQATKQILLYAATSTLLPSVARYAQDVDRY